MDIFAHAFYLLGMIGTAACAISGTLLALQKRFDFFGCLLAASITAIGGGTLRDLLLQRHPIFWIQDIDYLYLIIITCLLVQIFYPWYQKINWTLKFFDAIGLAVFSVTGVSVAAAFGLHPLICVLMAAMTAVAGGLLRDMICNEIPLVLQKEIYISASVIGALFYLLTPSLGETLRQSITFLVVLIIRLLAIAFDWHLPPIMLKKR